MNYYQKVYDIVAQIPSGRVVSYGWVAAMAGNSRASRIVGQALHRNPDPSRICCHRVVSKSGAVAERFAFGGGVIQRQLLESEGVRFDINGNVLEEYFIR